MTDLPGRSATPIDAFHQAHCCDAIDGVPARCRCPEPDALSGRVSSPEDRPEWGEVAMLPRGKYRVVEQDDGWHVYSREYEQGMSAPARTPSPQAP